ncbi:MAG: hypothetical protein ISR64_09775 [Deltaproteobacteria bacterium]|nr:hypothetical protein [Deltaproteobacteria bacterium]
MRDTICALGLVLMMGCGSGNSLTTDSGGDAASGALTLSGKLVAGAQTSAAKRSSVQSALTAEGDPLVGYQLYCVTFATPPTAASGTADATGQVTLDLDALGVAFGCFVLDADGNGVATLIFTSGAQQGQTITLTGDTDLGSITVDLNNGVAQTVVTSTGTLTGSSGLPCPLGAWVIDVPRDDCDLMAKATTWFVRTDTGDLKVSFTLGPVQLAGTGGLCGNVSQVDIPVTEDGDTLTFSFPDNPVGCPSRMRTLVANPNADCTEIAITSSVGPCMACADGQCGCEEGTETCTGNFTATRE